MNVRHFMIPGLSFEEADRCGLTSVAARSTQLVSSFPATLAAQEATLLTGTPPSAHGVLFPGEDARRPLLIEPWHERDDSLLGDHSTLDLRDRILAEADQVDLLLVSGCPNGTPTARIVDPSPVAPAGFSLRLDDTFALCSPDEPDRPLPPGVMDSWLAIPGIERVLAPSAESAGAWMAPADRGWILVAEQGWAFRAAMQTFGRLDGPAGVLLAFGRPWPVDWPAGVHDWRVAPTILELAGQDASDCFDRPLEGARGLRG